MHDVKKSGQSPPNSNPLLEWISLWSLVIFCSRIEIEKVGPRPMSKACYSLYSLLVLNFKDCIIFKFNYLPCVGPKNTALLCPALKKSGPSLQWRRDGVQSLRAPSLRTAYEIYEAIVAHTFAHHVRGAHRYEHKKV